MKWDPEQTINILKDYVYSKNKLDEYRNRVALSNIELPPFYIKDDPSQSVSAIVVRFLNAKEIEKTYNKELSEWILKSVNEAVINSLNTSDNLIGIHQHENIYLALFVDNGDLNYLIEIANFINTTIQIINYTLYDQESFVKTVKIGLGIANDPTDEKIQEYADSFIVPFDDQTKDAVLLAETYTAEVIMFNNLPVCTDAWVFINLNEENKELIRANAKQYFNTKMPHQRIFTDLVDLDIKKQMEKGTLKLTDDKS